MKTAKTADSAGSFGRVRLWWAKATVVAVLMAGLAVQADKTWDGTSGWWSDAAKWGGAVPGDGENVILPAGAYTLTIGASSENLTSYTQNGGTLCFSNWTTALTATDVTIAGGKVECLVCDTNAAPGNTNRVWIVATNLTVGASGSINVNAKGFRGGVSAALSGQGPGGGPDPASGAYGRGGGYGGLGGASYYDTWGLRAQIYGEATSPVWPGSGGGYRGAEGGAGGGAIRLEVTGGLTVHGAITANGAKSTGSGSGGSIYITCATVAGNGMIQAQGGNLMGTEGGTVGAGGGGGRVAIVYDPVAQSALPKPGIRFSAAHGCADPYYNQDPLRNGGLGTVFFTDWQILQTTISYPVSGQFISGSSTGILEQLTIASSNRVHNGPYAPNDADNTWVAIYGVRQMTVSNQASIINGARLDISNCVMRVGGGLTVTNSGKFNPFAGETNSGTAAYGALVAVTNGMLIANGGWVSPISHPTNGGSVLFRVGSLNIATTNAGFNADGFGYGSHTQYPNIYTNIGYGPGGGGYRSGGGYGGQGSGSYPGKAYGNTNAPLQCGSGGGYQHNGPGMAGGGLVWIEASGAVSVSGTIVARGLATAPGGYDGAGAGGGIFIRCAEFSGTTDAVLSAKGGNGVNAGAGGGGRIAVWYKPVSEDNAQKIIAGQLSQVVGPLLISTNIPAYLGAVSAPAGTGGSGGATAGSIVFLAIGPPKGTLMVVK